MFAERGSHAYQGRRAFVHANNMATCRPHPDVQSLAKHDDDEGLAPSSSSCLANGNSGKVACSQQIPLLLFFLNGFEEHLCTDASLLRTPEIWILTVLKEFPWRVTLWGCRQTLTTLNVYLPALQFSKGPCDWLVVRNVFVIILMIHLFLLYRCFLSWGLSYNSRTQTWIRVWRPNRCSQFSHFYTVFFIWAYLCFLFAIQRFAGFFTLRTRSWTLLFFLFYTQKKTNTIKMSFLSSGGVSWTSFSDWTSCKDSRSRHGYK